MQHSVVHPPPSGTLKDRVLRAGGWSFAGYGVSQAMRLGGNLIMTRLLVPEMFGVMAIATMVLVILGLLSDLGLRQNIVQSSRGDDPVFLDTAWMVEILRGAALWMMAILLSVALHLANIAELLPAESVYTAPELPLIIAVSSASALISGLQSTRMATAIRNFDQKALFQIELIGQIAGLIVMVVFGAMTRSIWALVAGGLVASFTVTTLSHTWLSGHANSFRYEASALREVVRFGKWVFLSSAVFVFAANGDRLLLGSFVSAEVLGYYAIAALIIGALEGAFTRLFSTVSLPALSEVARNDPTRLRDIYYKLRVPGDLSLLFLMGLLYTSGQAVIDVLYDPRYSAAGAMLEILGLSLFAARFVASQQLYLAVGIPRLLAAINAVRLVAVYALVPTLYLLGGTSGAIWGIALHALATVPLFYAFNARLGLNDFRRELLVLPALPAGLLCGLAVTLIAGQSG